MDYDSGKLGRIRDRFYSMGFGNTSIFPIWLKNGSTVFAKLEYFNKFGSVKDRAAFFMVNWELENHSGNTNKIFVEGTSGNTGIAIGNICREMGIKSRILIPPGTFPETVEKLRESGAEIEFTDEEKTSTSTEKAIQQSIALMKEDPEQYIALHQHGNDMNWLAHVYTTGPEAEKQIGIPDYVCICMGTGGSIMGVGRYFKERSSKVKVVMGQADGKTFIQGIRNYEKAKDREIIDRNIEIVDSIITVTQEQALESVRELADDHGIFVGASSGANYHCARMLAMNYPGSRILTIFPDSGVKYGNLYASTGTFTESAINELSRSALMKKSSFIA